ncbi:MAG: YdcF family protein [Methylacidiphilales bacterium]|nr:YdcF family protein [Candidatus Methylacidiphilales bacterium]
MRRFFYTIIQFLGGVFVVFLFTIIWILFDGLTDLGDEANVAAVFVSPGYSPGATIPALDLAVKLYKEGEFRTILVSGFPEDNGESDPDAMAKYLEDQQIPAGSIVTAYGGKTLQGADQEMADIVKSHHFKSVLIISEYYHITRAKLIMSHAGITDASKAHVGGLHQSDGKKIAREVVALYTYIWKDYALPAVEKLVEDAQRGLNKVKTGADKAKAKVNNGLDSLSK